MLQACTLAVLGFGTLIVMAGKGLAADPADLAEQMKQAKQAMLAHRYDEAVSIYKNLIKALPSEAGLRFNLALALHSSARYREAVQQLEAIRADEQENANFWFLLGLGYLKLEEPRKAIEPLRRAKELGPSNLDARQELVSALLESGYRTQGIAELRELVVLRPADQTIQAKLAKELWANRKYEEAIPMLESLVMANPQQPDWQFELGDGLFAIGRAEDAIVHLQKAAELVPNLLAAHAKLGEALLQAGDPAAAIPHLELAESLDTDGSIHFELATAYRRVGKTELASRTLARYKEIQKGSPSSRPD